MNTSNRIITALLLIVLAVLLFGPMGLIVIIPALLAMSGGKDAVRFFVFLKKHPVHGYAVLAAWVALMAWLFG